MCLRLPDFRGLQRRRDLRFGSRGLGTDAAMGLRRIYAGYADEPQPFAPYAGLMTFFNVAYAGAALLAARSRGGLPERYSLLDVALVGAASHKLSRLIAEDKVTTPLRAPFARFKEDAPHGEVDE